LAGVANEDMGKGVEMIEATSITVDGKTFLETLKILEPDMKWHGVGVHLVARRLLDREPEFENRLKVLGLRRVFYAPEYRSFFYTQTYPAIIAVVLEFFARKYWRGIWWVYRYGRIFQEIPIAVEFSWSYFTPLAIIIKVVKWFKRLR